MHQKCPFGQNIGKLGHDWSNARVNHYKINFLSVTKK